MSRRYKKKHCGKKTKMEERKNQQKSDASLKKKEPSRWSCSIFCGGALGAAGIGDIGGISCTSWVSAALITERICSRSAADKCDKSISSSIELPIDDADGGRGVGPNAVADVTTCGRAPAGSMRLKVEPLAESPPFGIDDNGRLELAQWHNPKDFWKSPLHETKNSPSNYSRSKFEKFLRKAPQL